MMNQEVTKPITTSPFLPVNVVASNTMAPQVTTQQRSTTDNTKEKCREFLADLLELSSREPKVVERNVRTLIQELIDTDVEPAELCDGLERLLNASPQSCLIGFLKKSLPLLRQSLVTKEVLPVTSTSSVVTQTVAATITTATTTPSTVTAAASSTPTPPVQSPLGDKRQSQLAD